MKEPRNLHSSPPFCNYFSPPPPFYLFLPSLLLGTLNKTRSLLIRKAALLCYHFMLLLCVYYVEKLFHFISY